MSIKLDNLRPAWVEVNLDNLHANFDAIRRQAPRAKVLAAIKANAYGQGLLEISREFAPKADYFGAAFLQEALALRQAGLRNPILIFGPGQPADAPAIARWNLDQTLTSWEMAESLAAAGQAAGRPVRVHVKIDTGMGRLGLTPGEAPDFLLKIGNLPGLLLTGIFSHFPANLNNFPEFTRNQLSVFINLLDDLHRRGFRIPLRHIASSAAIFQLPESHLDMVRPGGCLYGMGVNDDCAPVMALKARVSHIREMPPGTFISYRLTYRTKERTRIAILPLGYADGLPRALSNQGHALIGGRRYPIVGVVCMDQTMVDIGQAEIKIGDEAVLIGRQGEDEITIKQMVDLIDGTSVNEIACRISQRLPRIYTRDGRPVYVNHGYLPAAGESV